jgi:C4-dicarboxylate-specific signal transduction histidine kinase
LIRDKAGQPDRVSGIADDVTEDKRAEEALAQARAEVAHGARLSTIGQLAASIAHEVNQPLAAMVANAAACDFWLSSNPPETPRAQKVLKTIVADGQRASAIIDRIRGLLKRRPPRKVLIHVNEIIGDVLMLARYDLRRAGVAVETSLAEELPPAWGDPVLVQQVLLNLIVNAMDAMGNVDKGSRRLVIASERDIEGRVVVTVRDSGPGFAGAVDEHLFDPFYTTKENGMGMGLAVSRSAIESQGGRIWASPNEPRGAAFHFTLLAAET